MLIPGQLSRRLVMVVACVPPGTEPFAHRTNVLGEASARTGHADPPSPPKPALTWSISD
jgi:hypothetical protein